MNEAVVLLAVSQVALGVSVILLSARVRRLKDDQ